MRFLALFIACLFSFTGIGFSTMTSGEMGELPSTGRCTAENFGRSDGNKAVLPSASLQTQITDFAATKGSGQVTLGFNGVAALFGSDNIGQLTGSSEKRVFLLVYRCDENGTATAQWDLITPTTGDISAIKYTAVEDSNSTGFDARTFVDTFTGVPAVDSKYWYIGFTIVSSSDNPAFFSVLDDPTMLGTAITAFDEATNDTAITWSDPVVTFASFLPEQDHLVVDLSNPANSTPLSGGRVGAVASPRLTDTTIDAQVSHTLTALSEEANFSTTPTYSWAWSLSLNGSAVSTPAGLSFTTGTNTLMVSGTFGNADAAPGDYVLHATNTASDGTTTLTTTGMLAWLVQARQVKTDAAADATVVAVEIGNTESFTLTRTWGFADGGANSRSSEVTVNWTISNVTGAGAVQFDKTSETGNSATFSVTFADDDNLVGAYTFDLTVAEACTSGAGADCAALVTSNTISYGVQALGHDFTFANRATETAQGNQTDKTTFVPIYKDSNQVSIPDFVNYVFQAVNMKSGFTPLTTAAITIVSMTRNGTPVTVAGGTASAGGVTVSTSSVTANATVTADLTSTVVNDEFVINIQGDSSTSSPATTAVTIAFIVLEAAAPTVAASSVLDDGTGNAFAWPGSFNSSSFPALSGQDARVSVTFSENVTGPQVRIDSGGVTGATAAMSGSGTDYTHVVTSGALAGFLGTGDSGSFVANFSAAVDQNNIVMPNTMADDATTFQIARTPEPEDTLGTPGTAPHPRNSSFTITFEDEITGGDVADIRAGLTAAAFGDYNLTVGVDGRSVTISPLPGRNLITSGTSASISLAAGSVFNAGGFPNTKVGSYTGVTFEADANPPVLLAQSVQADDFRTNVSYTLTFNEPLAGTATVTVNNLTAGGSSTFTANASANSLTVATATLSNDVEYQFQVEVTDTDNNSVTVDLEPFFTLPNDAQTQAEIAAANAADTTDPSVSAIVPDFRLAANQVNTPLRPIISVMFSEIMADSTTSSVWVSDTAGASSGVALNVEAFDGVTLTVNPSSELAAGTKYWVTFGAGAQDLSANALTAVTYTFTTYAPPQAGQQDTNTAPQFLGTNMVGTLERDATVRLYFSEPVDVASLDSAVTIWNGSMQAVAGAWVLDGADATFATTGIVPGGSYTYSVWTSRVADLLGKTESTGEKVDGSFSVKADTAIRDFKVSVEGSGSTLAVTASWVPPVDRGSITGYTLSYQALDSDFNPTGSSTTLVTNDSVNASKIKTTGSISGFSAGSSYQFVVTADGAGTTASVDVLSVADVTAQLAKELVSILSKTSVSIGTVSTDGDNQGTADIPPGALEESTEISISFTLDTNLKDKDGGGERYSEVVQFGPDGLVFQEPVEIGLRFTPDGGLTSLASSCASLDSTCEADLLNALNALVFDTESKTWSRGALAKGRVEALDANTGVLYARTPHFSSFVVAQSFNIVSPDDNTTLSTATIGTTTYTTSILLSGTPSSDTVAVSFNPSDLGFVADVTSTDNNEVEISNSSLVRPASGPGATANSVTVTVTVTDVADNNRTDTHTYTIPILDLNGDPDFEGAPVGVDSFVVTLSNSGRTANLTWSIASDTTTRSIDTVVVGYQNLSASSSSMTTVGYTRGQSTDAITVSADSKYSWKIWTVSAQGNRSAMSSDIERFTFGEEQSLASDGNTPPVGSGNIILTFTGTTGDTITYNGYSSAQLLTLTGTGGILLTSNTAAVPNGTLTFFQESLVDISFNGATASVSFTLNETGNLAVYHYSQTATAGAWEELPTCTGGEILCSTLNVGATSTQVIITSNGAGSPFVVGPRVPAPVQARRSGGGCLSVVPVDADADPVGGIMNLLLMLLPLGYFMLRKMR